MRASFAYGQRCWGGQPYRAIVWVPMLVKGTTLAEGASGKYDEEFRQIARVLMQYKRGDSYLRIGHEFNGNWYHWAARPDPENWKLYFRRIVKIFRETHGAKFKMVWNPGLGRLQIAPDKVYPGDDVVDVIGVDFYNRMANPADTDPEKRWQRYLTQPYGLNWLADFAALHHKPIAIPEWGTGTTKDGLGPGDDPIFVEHMARWIKDHDVLFQGYWDFEDPDYNSALSTGQYPLSGAVFRREFGAPAPTNTQN
jgi:hypothetical protein